MADSVATWSIQGPKASNSVVSASVMVVFLCGAGEGAGIAVRARQKA
jgi:hypothetical protein